MADSLQMTNLQLQDDILKNLLLGLQKQSQYYVTKISETGELTEERKNFEKELSDINKVLTELSNKALSYTVQELDNLRTQFNDRLIQLNEVISDLEINTLKIEFNSLTPEQKQFLKGEKGEKGEKGDNLYQFSKMFGFLGTETEFLESLKGDNGKDFKYSDFTPEQLESLKGDNGKDFKYSDFTPEQLESLKGDNGKDFKYSDFTPEQLELLKGADGKSLTYDDLTQEQKQQIADLVVIPIVDLTSILDRIRELENKLSSTVPTVPTTPTTPKLSGPYWFKYGFTPVDGDEIIITVGVDGIGSIVQNYSYSSLDGNLTRNNLSSSDSLVLNGVCLDANFNYWSDNISTLQIILRVGDLDGGIASNSYSSSSLTIVRGGDVLPSSSYPALDATNDYNMFNSWVSQWL